MSIVPAQPGPNESPFAAVGTSALALAHPAAEAVWFTVDQAAEALGCDPRHVRRLCAQGKLQARQDATGVWTIDPSCKPVLAIAAGLDVPLALAGEQLQHLTPSQRAEVQHRLAAVRACRAALDHRPEGWTVDDWRASWLAAWNVSHKDGQRLTRRTIMRWDQQLRESGISGLIDRRRLPTSGGTACSDQAWAMFLGLYLDEARPSIPRLWETVAAYAQTEGWSWPALRTIQLRVKRSTDPRLLAAGREARRFRDRCLPTVERDGDRIPAMGLWVADHRQFDVFLPKEVWVPKLHRSEWHWFRPWITAFLDYRTWKPPCWRIRFESPNGQQVMETFCQGVIDHGQPGAVYLDNGKDFRMYRFSGGRRRPARQGEPIVAESHVKGMLELLGVAVHFAAPYNAKAKVIEPWFGQVSRNFDKRWPTYCGDRSERRPERLKLLNNKAAEMHAAGYTLEAFSQAFAQWVTGDYGLRPSPAEPADGLSPERAFMELRAPDFQPTRPSIETLCLLLMPSQRVKVEPNGVYVAAFGQHYDSPVLEDRRCGSGRDLARKVTYRWMSQDPGKVYVFDATSDRFLCVATPYIGSAIHPLAPADSEDAKRLAATMQLRNGLAKRMNRTVRDLRGSANARLLGSAQAAGMLGILDDPSTILPAPAAVIRIAGATEQHQLAATADAQDVADVFATGSDPADLSDFDAPSDAEDTQDAWDLLTQATEKVGDNDEQPVRGSGPADPAK